MNDWRPVLGFDNYEVSSNGKVRHVNGKEASISRQRWGYLVVALKKNGKRCPRLLHRILCEAFHGPQPTGYVASRLDNNKITADTVCWRSWAEVGAAHRKTTVDHHFFDNIDTESKAYWLGMLTADGWISERDHVIGIGLQEKDLDHLRRYKDDIAFTGKITSHKTHVRKGGKDYNSYRVDVCSPIMFATLRGYGFTTRKSYTSYPVDKLLPLTLRRHYWRGLVDGDGWITPRNDCGWNVGLCGTESICKGFGRFTKESGIPGGAIKEIRDGFWKITYSGSVLPFDVAHLLYANCTVALARKEARALAVLSNERHQRSVNWPPYDQLEGMRFRLGSWKDVAKAIGTQPSSLWRYRCSEKGSVLTDNSLVG